MKKEPFSFRGKLLEDQQSKWQQYLEIFLSSWLILQESHTKKRERLQWQWNRSQRNVYKEILQSPNGQCKASCRRTLIVYIFFVQPLFERASKTFTEISVIYTSSIKINARCVGDKKNCERFEPRSHFKRLSLIVRVNVVLNRTVDSDWRFDNLCGSHLQSQSELYHVSWWYYTLVIDLIGQLRRDVIGHLSVSRDVIGFEDS